MKSISAYIYNKRRLLSELLFWLFWFLYGCMYVGSYLNTFKSGVLIWSLNMTLASYIIYRLALFCVRRLFINTKYIWYLFLLMIADYVFKGILNELIWQVTLRYFDYGTFHADYNKMVNITGGGFWKRIEWVFSNPEFYLMIPSRWMPISLKLMYDLVVDQRKNNALEKNKMDLEIKLLKAQINPQFIDESLENIKNVVKINSEKAELMTLKLSNMIRYTLYETDVENVALQKELDFMINYVDLQETRLADTANVNLRLKTNTRDNLMISPLLVFPLLEKAFRCIKSNCDIDMKVQDDVFELKIEADSVPDCVHAGVQNVQKRLAFLYPNKHKLKVIENVGVYKVDLSLEL